ncbi:glycoside hydrolase family 28 protein [Pedobacter frigidisoli]|uniref:Glycoside hydrolase family 28 protein n=1 Tax=Pedobacter frigidisoli TaxID=2530455 RepID=A0A4R0NWG4_9SPHI|nr:glycoside hydrolase family 28 protein [Pedobacter frigidisoli]TCD05607.1 glycoside hydrolase family 28 protein [Pedobacter frigidisoli]
MIKTKFLKISAAAVLISIVICHSFTSFAKSNYKFNLLIAPGSLSENSITLLWDKQYDAEKVIYEVYLNGKIFGTTTKTNFTATQLLANTDYIAEVKLKGNKTSNKLNTVRFKTNSTGKIFNILDYGAKADASINTKEIQATINACSKGGTVYIPKGKFISGALFLKSDMTLYIEDGGILKGSVSTDDYLPMILNRFEGWEMKTYASLLNAGKLNRYGSYNVKNLRITGKGTIMGGGKKLGDAMTKANGIRSRGRLICLMNCQNVNLSNLTITEPPCWTIHYIYSDKITCDGLSIITTNIRYGDGIDPDSSTDSYIFNCVFDTGDDCIAIKSGKNPEGYFIAKPTKNVRITDCDFKRGHGISIGSEMSGGVSNVLVQDCKAGKLLHGMQIKATKDRGGYVRNVTVSDCQLMQITIFSAVNYNNDGEAAPEIPKFENFEFKNIDMSMAIANSPVININGFKDPKHRLKNVIFSNILLPENAKVVVNDAVKINFNNVKSVAGIKPGYKVTNGFEMRY